MEGFSNYHAVIDKIRDGEHFGLFDDGEKCYFQDGVRVSYTGLWIALREVYELPKVNHKTLHELCPENFEGNFQYKFSKHTWKKRSTANQ